MPSGNLPNSGALGDSQVTTGDYQTQINQLLSYVRSLKAEVDALSGTTIREGAVRGVGASGSDLADNDRLESYTNTRLGTSENLQGLAGFNPSSANEVFSGFPSQQFVTQAELSEDGEGFYVVRFLDSVASETGTGLIYYKPGPNNARSLAFVDPFASGRTNFYVIGINDDGEFFVSKVFIEDDGTSGSTFTEIAQIWKV